MSTETDSPTHYGHHVSQDEDGETYYLTGHVPARRAIAAANRCARVDCGLVNLFDGWPSDGLQLVRHVWWRDHPEYEDSDLMVPCGADDDGAQAFTEVSL